nr:hypothetical protein [Tanacetum cinerariifolium]
MKDKFQMSSMGELTFFLGLQVKQKKDGIFISQDKYVAKILKKFELSEGKSTSTPIDAEKPLLKDSDVDVHTYRTMIGSLMYLTSSRLDIMFAKQTVVATSSIDVEYVVAISGCAQVLWIQNQLLDYRNMVMEITVLNILSDALPITTNGQMATGKESSNLFMAGSLPKTIMLTFLQIICSHMSPFEFTFVNAEGVVCLPNEEIFAGLAQMGYDKPSTKLTFYKAFFSSQWKFLIHTILQSLSAKRTSWNEFSTAMASAVICLSKGQKFNFSKYIFDSLVRNVDSSSKFYMYPRFIQLIIQNQVGDLSTHTTRFISPALTQKVFANMRRVGKGFSGVETPLFEGMLVARPLAEEGITEKQVQADDVVAATVEENVTEDGAKFPTHIQQALDVCSALTRRVKNLEHDNAAQRLEIIKLQARVKRLERANKVKSSKLRRLRKVGASKRVKSSDDMEDVFNQGRMIDDLDKDEGIELLITDVVTAASQVSAASATISAAKPSIPAAAPTVVAAYTRRRKGKRPQTECEDCKNIMIYLKNTAGYKMDFFKGMAYAEICPIFHVRFDENMRFLFKSREEMEDEDQEIIKSINETPAQKAAKRRKLSREAQEAKDLRKRLEVVDDEDDDVFIEATPLARKMNKMLYGRIKEVFMVWNW